MGEISLDKALVLLSSEKQRERLDGLADLKHIFQQNKQNSKLSSLSDKACHKIFESLFRFIAAEKSAFIRANSKGPSASRLSTCASVIRTAVDVFLHSLRTKSVRAITDHITDILLTPGQKLFDLLCVDYTKCLSTLLSYPPHVEHLGASEWEKLISFCLRSIGLNEDEDSDRPSSNDRRSTLDDFMTGGSRSSTPSRSTSALAVREKPRGNQSTMSEALNCIQLLTASPSAPIQDSAERILDGLAKFLKSSAIAGSGHLAAISSLNSVITRVLFDQSNLVRTSLLDLIPTIRHLWATKLMSLKDELLVTITLCMVIMIDAARREPSELLAKLIESLVDTLYSEYTRRPEKDTLQIDELIFYQKASAQGQRFLIGPRHEIPRSEHNWTIVWAISKLMEMSEEVASRLLLHRVASEGSSKKQRLTSLIEDVFRDSIASSGVKRVCALQLIPFLIQHNESVESRDSLLRRLTPYIPDDNSTISSWTMVAIASIAGSPGADSSSLRDAWQRVWDLTSRASTSHTTSRAACTLMNSIIHFELLEYSERAEAINSMLSSVNLNGPSVMSDSSLALWATVTRAIAQINPGSVPHASKLICTWLREAWTIGTITDRILTAQVAAFARPLDLFNLILACTNRPYAPPMIQFRGPEGLVARGWKFFHRTKQLLCYVFDLEKSLDIVDLWCPQEELNLDTFTQQDPNDFMVMELLHVKSEMFLQNWLSLSEDRSTHITVDVVQILTSFCIVSTLYTESMPQQAESRSQNVRKNTESLWRKICAFLDGRDMEFVQACLMLLSPFLGPKLCSSGPKPAIMKSLRKIINPLSRVLEGHRQTQRGQLSAQGKDHMDLDDHDPLLSSNDRPKETADIVNMNREAVPVFRDFATFQRCLTVQLSVFQRLQAPIDETGQHANNDLIEYLADLDEVDILSARDFLPHVYRACSDMERSSMVRVLEDTGEKCLQSYELERCENSHLLCIHLMHSFVEAWAAGQSDHLSDSASDIYTWFTDVLLAKGRASPSVLIGFAELLGGVLKSNTSFTTGKSSPSARTSLLTIIHEGEIAVKFGAADIICQLFNQYPLKDHDAIFDDILDSLPRDPDWCEGIALRLYILAQLASRWHTLLRRSIYHMFETPAQVPESLWSAEKCVGSVARILGLKDTRELFRLFSSQILYTWTETESIASMPFSIFGYPNLESMLNDVQDEIVGQIMMRARDDDTAELSKYMKKAWTEILAESFYKAEAYTISRDISTPPGQGSQPKGVENRVKKMLGTQKFLESIDQHFAQTIATFFVSMDQYEQIERAFSKRGNYHGALQIMNNITGKSVSKIVLPANQQPSFRARYLLDELEFFCERSGYELDTIWTPTLASYVCRALLELIHPALGSLHACSVIRKIRVLVCVAGPVMLRDYPFEMLLHSLRPFLTDIYCSEDALGIFWYLLEAGRDYLIENPSLMAGITVSTFLSLREFMVSPPKDAIHESLSRIVLSAIQTFMRWFETYLEAYDSSVLNTATRELFRRMIKSSQGTLTTEPRENDTSKRDLLLDVLDDRSSGKSLLSKPISDHVISLLCIDSNEPPDFRQPTTGERSHYTPNTVAIYETLQNFETSSQYKLWAAKIIGRDFAATGTISDDLLREQDLSLFKTNHSNLPLDPFFYSKASILQTLCNRLQSSKPMDVGLFERTLQLIVSNLTQSPAHEESGIVIPPSLMKALTWSPYKCPASHELGVHDAAISWNPDLSISHWARDVGMFLSRAASEDPVIGPLNNILSAIPDLAAHVLPYILHDVLCTELDGDGKMRQKISEVFSQALREVNDKTIPHARLVINCMLYLRNQPRPNESTIVERDEWLAIDFAEASSAATRCRLPKTALLFLEIHSSRAVSSSRSSVAKFSSPPEELHEIFKNIDDPDFFYGIPQSSSLESVMETLEHESSGFKNLLFQSAQYDSERQMSGSANNLGVLKALNSTNLQGIANCVFNSTGGGTKDMAVSFESMLQAATNLRQWDIPISPLNPSPSATIFRAFQTLNTSAALSDVSISIDESFLATLGSLTSTSRSAMSLRTATRVLGTLVEISDVLCATSAEEIDQEWENIAGRSSWLKNTNVHEVGEILNCHEALFSSIKRKDYLKSAIGLNNRQAQLLEVNVIRQSLNTTRDHGIAQASLKSAVCLSKLADHCNSLGIDVEGAAKFDLANVLWDQGEMTASIRMLQQLNDQNDLHKQAVPISRADLLVTLGHHVAEARLEKPEAIIQEYLAPAVKELKARTGGEEAGRVYHGFAMFCDQQLQNPDSLEDFKRIEQIRNRKQKEVQDLEDMMKGAEAKDKDGLRYHRIKTKQWFDLDDREYQRLRRSREAFLQQSLENYLLCLKESEKYNNDVLRFCALWLDTSESDIANAAVSKYLHQVPSRKLAPLMNQLSSRLLDVADDFQKMLFSLIFRICVEHPFHGMYQIFSSSKSKGGKDETALSRNRAAGKLVEYLKKDKRMGPTWIAVHNTNINYVRFAVDRMGDKLKSGAKVPLKKLSTGQRLEQDVVTQKLPPPTMSIDIRIDCDYSNVPKLVRFNSEFTVASGVSAPKILTAFATNGQRYKQLFKGGNDDLRQDAIMEQVFEQVSSLLKDHQATRQRNLGIRTYKVLPLTSNSGIIEFVPHTVPLHDFLMPAHQRYFPKDMKPNVCRKHIGDVQTRSFETRVKTFRQVTDHFHPVMRFFFMEKFNNPDDWFAKRLSYTRSTAAISILGHVLGLGDRHGHNILLDERTGEVVHIDLGVAFEQGRVLPVPEVVPFRLTRDLVDGMGITKTEGVFRRCCEFTLEALRQESYSIMTILDVLRYDPLYSWTVSPLRMRKIQDAPETNGAPEPPRADQRPSNEPSEADRALTVVAKKLGKTLSVTATVNELIQQATDEKNLALLYCGWAAYV
ncbi:serine/threonine-protein kinase tel1 [Aspergillus steynii IBT 23096]|uniref:Serine/threonine-protein kinase Tel1 n=1 Tax=Aspergillus steynii IBT 23096 TaxID=1392250 RepID=A0A2I2FUQ8_9EURO|nr:serine/threonine-protein kinase tel1 [Aspergillus steynii IBT 23096]PLB44362.1 serine/threonine-protein kinase tel1 [Aspergillus steynii IBT 23096]